MTGKPLPPKFPLDLCPSALVVYAYQKCIDLEGVTTPEHHLEARILGYTLIEVPSLDSRLNLAKDISSCKSNDSLIALAKIYIDFFAKMAMPPDDPRSPTEDKRRRLPKCWDENSMQESILKVDPRGKHMHHTSRSLALIRDQFRCTLSLKYDLPSCDYPFVRSQLEKSKSSLAVTRLGHIHPASTCKYETHEYITNVLIPHQLDETTSHSLSNLLTLDVSVYCQFFGYRVWLEEKLDEHGNTIEHHYQLKSVDELDLRGLQSDISFRAAPRSNPLLAPPEPTYLKLHAACARIALSSGIHELIREMLIKKFNEDLADTDTDTD